MVWFGLVRLFSAVVDLIIIGRLTGHEKDLESMLLRQQLSILQRTQHRPSRIRRSEKLSLAVLTTKLNQGSGRSTLLGRICTSVPLGGPNGPGEGNGTRQRQHLRRTRQAEFDRIEEW